VEIADLDEMDKTTRRGLVEMRRKLNIKAGMWKDIMQVQTNSI